MYIVHCTQSYIHHVHPFSITEVWNHVVQRQLFAELHVHVPVHVVHNMCYVHDIVQLAFLCTSFQLCTVYVQYLHTLITLYAHVAPSQVVNFSTIAWQADFLWTN